VKKGKILRKSFFEGGGSSVVCILVCCCSGVFELMLVLLSIGLPICILYSFSPLLLLLLLMLCFFFYLSLCVALQTLHFLCTLSHILHFFSLLRGTHVFPSFLFLALLSPTTLFSDPSALMDEELCVGIDLQHEYITPPRRNTTLPYWET